MAMVRNYGGEVENVCRSDCGMPQMTSFNIDKTDITAIGCFVKRYRNEKNILQT
jgi:hypothetical protein